jgi:hypothetical protein
MPAEPALHERKVWPPGQLQQGGPDRAMTREDLTRVQRLGGSGRGFGLRCAAFIEAKNETARRSVRLRRPCLGRLLQCVAVAQWHSRALTIVMKHGVKMTSMPAWA